MEDMTESEASLAWVWVIEAMASFKEASLSLLHDLVQAAPELPCGLVCNVKERIALRCLEDLLARQARIPGNAPLPLDSKLGFDFSESCEDVLQRIVEQTSEADLIAGGSELAKWDIESFIRRKSADMPESALEKLSNLIRGGCHPEADFLKAKLGLGVVNRDVGVTVNDKNHCSVVSGLDVAGSDANGSRDKVVSDPLIVEDLGDQVERNGQNGDVLPSRKGRSDSGGEDRDGETKYCDGEGDFDVQNNNVKRVKQCASSDIHVVEENSVPLCGNGPEEDLPERNVSVSVSGIDVGGQEMGTREEGRVADDGCNDCTVSTRSCDNNNEELREDELGSSCNALSMPQEAMENEPNLHLAADGSKGVDENLNEPTGSPSFASVFKNSSEEPKSRNNDDFKFQGPNSSSFDGPGQKVIVDELKENTEDCCEAETSSDSCGYHDEKIALFKRKNEFLNSQLADSINPRIDGPSEQTLCMKCNEAGQALVCSGNSCQLVFHEKCISSFVIFYDKDKFYCPFCAYSLAITEYLEAKKRSSLSQKELSVFIQKGPVEHGHKKSVGSNKKKRCTGESKNANFDGANQLEERGQEEGNRVVNNANEEHIVIDNQQSELSKTHNVNTKEVRLHASVGGTGGEKKVVKEYPSRRSKRQNEALSPLDKLSSMEGSVDVVNQGKEDLGMPTEVVSERDSGTPIQLAREFDIDSDVSEESDDDESNISNYYVQPRKRKKEAHHSHTYPTIPQSRRKKLPWTAEEEQKLKEGVQEFSEGRNIQWKKILEFGDSVFLKGRTTVDLKDKWRNMCKASSRSKI